MSEYLNDIRDRIRMAFWVHWLIIRHTRKEFDS